MSKRTGRRFLMMKGFGYAMIHEKKERVDGKVRKDLVMRNSIEFIFGTY